MSPFDLSEQEWAEVNAQLPDTRELCSRIATKHPYPEDMRDFTAEGRIRVSNVCFRDASDYLGYARLSLGMAVGVRKHYMDRKQSNRDPDHVSADEWSRFYAVYTPLWLAAAVEHTLTGICRLYADRPKNHKKKGDYHLKWMLKGVKAELPSKTLLIQALDALDNNAHWGQIVIMRNNWSHNEPPRVETIMYDPSREHKVWELGGYRMISGGTTPPPKYSWDEFVETLKGGVTAVAALLDGCYNDWESEFDNGDYNPFNIRPDP